MWRFRIQIVGWGLLLSGGLAALHALYVCYAPGLVRMSYSTPPSLGPAFFSQWIRYGIWLPLLPLMAAFVHGRLQEKDTALRPATWIAFALSVPFWSVAHACLMAACYLAAGLSSPGYDFERQARVLLSGQAVQNSAMALLVLLAIATRYFQRRLRAEDQIAEGLRTEAANARLSALRSLVQPRIFFGTLQDLTMLIPREPDRAVELVDRLGDFLRLSLQRSGQTEVELRDEVEFLQKHLAVEEMRRGTPLQVHFDLAPEARGSLLAAQILPELVSQSLLESGWRALDVSARLVNGGRELRIEVRTDGPVAPTLAGAETILEERYPGKYTVHVSAESGRRGITVQFPVVSPADELPPAPLPAGILVPA